MDKEPLGDIVIKYSDSYSLLRLLFRRGASGED